MVSSFAFSQSLYRLVIKCINCYVKSSDSLYCHNLSAQKQARGFGDYPLGLCLYCFSFAVGQPYFRPTLAASHRLGVKTPVVYIYILSSAFITHRKRWHRGIGSVIRNIFYYRIPWPAISAVYEGIPIPKIFVISHLLKAVPAGGNIRCYLGHSRAFGIAFFDNKFIFGFNYRYTDRFAGFYFCQRWFVAGLQAL